jgi:aerobic C4-dicarboxylate transport protein
VQVRWLRGLYVQVLIAVVAAVALGHFAPTWGQSFKPLGDGFIKVVKMLIAPIVFSTVVTGIARLGDLRKVGRVGLKAFVYFETLTTFALVLGLVVAHLVAPGAGINADPSTLDVKGTESYTAAGQHLGVVDFVLGIIPTTFAEAFSKGEMLQVLFLSILTGIALAGVGAQAQSLVVLVDQVGHVFFGIVAIVMRFAPLGAFGAMAFTIGKYGLGSLAGLGKLMLSFYITSFLFVFVVLGAVCWKTGFSLWRFVGYLKEEIFLVLGTSSSESALPRLMAKLEALGCSKPVVGLVVPMGYSFNLDGTSIYLTMATLFMAQAMNIHLPLGQQLALLGVLMLTSKGAAAVTGGGFVTLAATLAATGTLPVAGLALLLGIDRFMSEARAITNLIGNAVATVVVAKWEGEVDMERVRRVLHQQPKHAP